MRISGKCGGLAVLAACALACAGCGGLNASHTVSPLDFFIPGGGGLMRGLLMKTEPPHTNAPVAFPKIPTELASVN